MILRSISPWSEGSASADGETTPPDPAARTALRRPTRADDDEFDDIAWMAASLLHSPITIVAASDGKGFRLLATRGLGASPLPRTHALCRATLAAGTLHLPDAAADPRFRDDAEVVADGVSFYLGVAITGADGTPIGVLAIADRAPRARVPDPVLEMLRRLARLAAQLLERRESRHLRAGVQRSAQQDALTGLPDRNALLATLDGLRASGAPLGVALLGLDNFRAVNDTLGHTIGDSVLQIVASRLLACLPLDAHLARFGGDEFALVFPRAGEGDIEGWLHAMQRELALPCEVDRHRVHIDAAIGLAMDAGNEEADQVPADGEARAARRGIRMDSSELMARAGLAMQQAKRSGGQRLRWFCADMRREAIDRRRLDLDLRRACRDQEFELHYQPQVDVASGSPTGAEALLRWRHPERGLLMPGDFIDALASSAVALDVGRWILQRACMDAAAWPEVDGRSLTVGVNLFPVQFEDERFLDEVDCALAASGLSPARLEIELTETIALRDDGVAERALLQLRARGIRVAYDDFGTGHASLSMLHRLPVDRVKIDRSFVRNVLENRGDKAIVRSIALIARNFDMQVIAEGVETAPQAAFLNALGCKDVQGFLYSRAMPSDDFHLWLQPHLGHDATPGPGDG